MNGYKSVCVRRRAASFLFSALYDCLNVQHHRGGGSFAAGQASWSTNPPPHPTPTPNIISPAKVVVHHERENLTSKPSFGINYQTAE